MQDEPETNTTMSPSFPGKRIYRQADTATPKTKRTRKPSTTNRVRQPKPQAILDIEAKAKAAKEKYRLAQSSAGVLDRINKLVLRLTPAHRTALFDELSKTETPKLLNASPGAGL